MIDVMQNKVLGPLVREQIRLGIEAGLVAAAREKSRRAAIAVLCRLLVEQRFGPLPFWAEIRIAEATPEMHIEWSLARDESESLEALIGLED